jgi:hypothetical protein
MPPVKTVAAPLIALVSVLGLALGLAPGLAHAATLSYVAQTRFVSITEMPSGSVQRVDATGFGSFDQTLVASDGTSTISQTSSFANTQILAEVRQDAADRRNVESSFSVTFDLDEPSGFQLTGQIRELDPVFDIKDLFTGFEFQILLQASLVGPDGSEALLDFDLQADCVYGTSCNFAAPFDVTGSLAPGTYTLVARSFATLPFMQVCFGFLCSQIIDVHTSTNALANVDFQLVPEPSTLAGTSVGLLLLAALARKRQRSTG